MKLENPLTWFCSKTVLKMIFSIWHCLCETFRDVNIREILLSESEEWNCGPHYYFFLHFKYLWPNCTFTSAQRNFISRSASTLLWCLFDLFFFRPAVPSGSDLCLRQRHENPQHRHGCRGCCCWRSGKNRSGKRMQIKLPFYTVLNIFICLLVCDHVV